MDSLALSAAVIQFVEFACGLISKGISIHSSMTGLTVDCHELKEITKSLSHSSNDIQQSLPNEHGGQRLTRNEKDLRKIAITCQEIADELLEVLSSLASNGPRTRWRSFRHALRATWNEKKVQSLESRLDRFRQQMMVNVLNSLRHEAERSIREQSSMRESVERIEQLQLNSVSVGDRFVGQVMDGEQWRRDLIQMIHEQGQGGLQKMANLTQLKDDKGWTPNAVVVQEKRIRKRILHKLAFRNMADRERRVSKAHQRTFEWIFCDPKSDSRPWSSFKDFLEGLGKKIYWITGKPGSGKSTLMKYIRYHPQTTSLLQIWGGNDEVVQAAFYFWNSGSRMQMSVDGLLQTVLHDCLRQLPHVVQEVLPERWEAATLFDVDDFPWSWEEVVQALRRLIMEICPEKKFFVMIDGLDECSGNQTQLIELINELAEDTENLKLCVAGRPWNNFEDAFKDRPSLMLQDLSATDIEWYITSKLTANEGFAEFQVRDRLRAKELLETISKKAEGVFLWVHLVVQSLLEGLTNGDGLRDLQNRLEELPPNLEDLYANILENLDDKYLDHASRLFQIVRACDDSPTLLCVALADLDDGERAIQAPVKQMSHREKSAVCKNMKRKLASRCRGLLDISSPVKSRLDDDEPVTGIEETTEFDCPQAGEAKDEVCGTSMGDLEVQYLHRSVRDYIQSSEMWSWLVSANEVPFDPHLLLLKSNLLQLKSLSPASLSAQRMGFHIWMAIKYAKRSFNIHTKKKKEKVKEVVLLLDEIDKAATLLTSSPVGHSSTFMDRSGTLQGEHWSSFFLIQVPSPSFLHVMAVCGVHQHLETRLRGSDLKKGDRHSDNTEESNKMPLMIAALEGAPSVPERQGYFSLFGPHLKVLKVLLRKGENCHKPYHGRSAWDLARNAGYADVLELFEEYRGKPPALPSFNGSTLGSRNGKDKSQPPATQGEHRDGSESDKESNASTEAVSGRRRRKSRERDARAVPSPRPPDSNAPSRNEQQASHLRHRSSPSLILTESSQYTTYTPPLHQLPRKSPSPPPPQSSRLRYDNSTPSPFYDPRRRYDDDDGAEVDYHRYLFHHGHDAHIPPRHRPVSYPGGSQPGIPMPTTPLHPSYLLRDYPDIWYQTERRPYTSYRSGWLEGPPLSTRRGYGERHWHRY
jgi:hypothetical protein